MVDEICEIDARVQFKLRLKEKRDLRSGDANLPLEILLIELDEEEEASRG